ncbi:MAG: metal-sulfur cluster assembly factor [Deltaproteobacteria bacterium]|nr:metal-sulfur cluster assembly factor [Deltaproteobacteria bacterium]
MSETPPPSSTSPRTSDQVIAEAHEALLEVMDPETGISVVDLGLIYDTRFVPEQRLVEVTMTLTTPACPAGDAITAGVQRRLERVAGVDKVRVELTFEPRWTKDRITEAGRRALGLGAR